MSPELVSIEYQPIRHQEVVLSPGFQPEEGVTLPYPSEFNIYVSQEEVDRFLLEQTLDTSDVDRGNQAFGIVFFMAKAIVRVRHSESVALADPGRRLLIPEETVEGQNLMTSENFIATANEGGITTYASLSSLVENGEINDYTADVVRQISRNGKASTPVTRGLGQLAGLKL